MTAQRGKDFLLKLGEDADGGGGAGGAQRFKTIAGLRTKTLSLNAQSVDVTHSQSVGGWRELLAGAGIRQASIAGAGVFLNDTASQETRAVFFAGALRLWQVIVPGLGMIEGLFQIANLDYGGEYDGEGSVSMSLASAGALSFEVAS